MGIVSSAYDAWLGCPVSSSHGAWSDGRSGVGQVWCMERLASWKEWLSARIRVLSAAGERPRVWHRPLQLVLILAADAVQHAVPRRSDRCVSDAAGVVATPGADEALGAARQVGGAREVARVVAVALEHEGKQSLGSQPDELACRKGDIGVISGPSTSHQREEGRESEDSHGLEADIRPIDRRARVAFSHQVNKRWHQGGIKVASILVPHRSVRAWRYRRRGWPNGRGRCARRGERARRACR